MAQGENAKRRGHPGKEFWGKRPWGGLGKHDKIVTHRLERHVQATKEIREQLDEA